jgi:hypothetical protein
MDGKEEKIEIVKRGVNEFAKVEQSLEDVVEGLRALEKVFKDGAEAKMLKDGAAHRIVNRLRCLGGKAGDIASEVYDLHDKGTSIAQKNEADVALPDGFVVALGGGR